MGDKFGKFVGFLFCGLKGEIGDFIMFDGMLWIYNNEVFVVVLGVDIIFICVVLNVVVNGGDVDIDVIEF